MKKVYFLGTCSTCVRIMNGLNLIGFEQQDIKKTPITEEQLNEMVKLAGSYEKLFSRRAMKYKSLGLAQKELTEQDYKNYILQEYTFLKRPVFIIDQEVFIGNSKKVVENLTEKLN